MPCLNCKNTQLNTQSGGIKNISTAKAQSHPQSIVTLFFHKDILEPPYIYLEAWPQLPTKTIYDGLHYPAFLALLLSANSVPTKKWWTTAHHHKPTSKLIHLFRLALHVWAASGGQAASSSADKGHKGTGRTPLERRLLSGRRGGERAGAGPYQIYRWQDRQQSHRGER